MVYWFLQGYPFDDGRIVFWTNGTNGWISICRAMKFYLYLTLYMKINKNGSKTLIQVLEENIRVNDHDIRLHNELLDMTWKHEQQQK